MAKGFSGSSEYLSNSNGPMSIPFTVNAWFNPDNVDDAMVLWAQDDGAASGDWARLFLGGNVGGDPVRFSIRDGSGGPSDNTADTSSGFSSGSWQMATGVATSSTSVSCFLDGGNKGTDTSSTATIEGQSQMAIGSLLRDSPGNLMDGIIAEVVLWNIALSDDDVARLYNGGVGLSPTLVRPDALVSYWKLQRGDDGRDWAFNYTMSETGTPTDEDHPPIIYPSGISMR